MKQAIRILLIIALLNPPWAMAKSRDEKLLDQSAEAAAKAVAEHVVRGYIDKLAASSASSAASAATGSAAGSAAASGAKQGVTAGGAVIFAVQLGFAIDDFSKADTDKAKGFAVADAVVAAATMVNPVVGLVAAAVVLIVKLIDADLSAKHAKWMMEIYARILNNYKIAAELETRMVKADAERFVLLMKQIGALDESVKAGHKYLKDECSDPVRLDSMEKIDSCLKSMVEVYTDYRRLAEISEETLNMQSRTFNVDAVLEKMEFPRAKFQKSLDEYKKSISKMNAVVDETLAVYGKWVGEILAREAVNEDGVPQAIIYKHVCLHQSNDLSLAAAQAVMTRAPRSALSDVREAMDDFLISGCLDLQTEDVALEGLFENSQQTFQTTYQLIQGGLK